MGSIQDTRISRTASQREVEVALTELSSNVRLSLAKLNGPLKDALREQLHDPENLPDAECYDLAAQVVDVLHEAQQSLEPRTLILADHFLGTPMPSAVNMKCGSLSFGYLHDDDKQATPIPNA